MNTLAAADIVSPYGKTETCAQFVIDVLDDPFILEDVTTPDKRYTLSLWVKADVTGGITIKNAAFPVTTDWAKCRLSFDADNEDISIFFDTAGTYHVYHTQLELGDKATDWTPAPEDVNQSISNAENVADEANEATNKRVEAVEATIEILNDCISMLVRDANGNSLMTQTGSGWSFNMADTQGALDKLSGSLDDLQETTGSTGETVKELKETVQKHTDTLKYVNISTFEDEPCIELGRFDLPETEEDESKFKLLITNTRVMFMDGNNVPTHINADGLVTQNIEVEHEIRQGSWVWTIHGNGNLGLMWKEVVS